VKEIRQSLSNTVETGLRIWHINLNKKKVVYWHTN